MALGGKECTYVSVEQEDPISFKSIFSYESAFTFTKGSSVGSLNEGAQDAKEIGKWEAGIRALALLLLGVILLPFSPIVLWKCVHYLPQWERVAIFRLGRFCGVKGPGYVLLLPCVDNWKKMDLRTKILLLRNIQVVTSDTAVMAFTVEILYRIADSETNVLRISEPEKTLESLCRTTIVNKATTTTQAALQRDRRAVGDFVREKLNDAVKAWGYEVSEVSLPEVVVQKEAVAVERSPLEPLQQVFRGLMGGGGGSSAAENPLLKSLSGPLRDAMKENFPVDLFGFETPAASPDPNPAAGTRKENEAMVAGGSRLKLALDSALAGMKKQPDLRQQGVYCMAPSGGRKIFLVLTEKPWTEEGEVCSLGVKPDVTVVADDEDVLIDVVTKRISPYEAYFAGSISVDGDMKKLLDLSTLF